MQGDEEFEKNAKRLKEIFKQQPADYLRSLLRAHGMHETIDMLLGTVIDKLWSGQRYASTSTSYVNVLPLLIAICIRVIC